MIVERSLLIDVLIIALNILTAILGIAVAISLLFGWNGWYWSMVGAGAFIIAVSTLIFNLYARFWLT